MPVSGEKRFFLQSRDDFIVSLIDAYSSANGDSVLVDQSATQVQSFHLGGGTAPTVSLGSADANFEKTVTVSGGSSGKVAVVTYHPGGASSSKPASRS